MSKQGMKWKITQALSAIMMVGFLINFGGVTEVMAAEGACDEFNAAYSESAQVSGATRASNMVDAIGNTAKMTANENGDKWKNVFGDMDEAYCISSYMDWYSAIQGLLSSTWAGFYALITTKIMEKVCEATTTVLNNMLDAAVCIPVDHLSFGLDLPTVSRETCSGLSLGDIGGFGQAPVMELFDVPEELRHLPISRGEDRL